MLWATKDAEATKGNWRSKLAGDSVGMFYVVVGKHPEKLSIVARSATQGGGRLYTRGVKG